MTDTLHDMKTDTMSGVPIPVVPNAADVSAG